MGDLLPLGRVLIEILWLPTPREGHCQRPSGLQVLPALTAATGTTPTSRHRRDHAGNRQLFFDQYAALMLLYFFNPVLTSLRGVQQASGLAKVQKLLGVRRTSLGSLSEATGVFAAEPLRAIVQELAERALPWNEAVKPSRCKA